MLILVSFKKLKRIIHMIRRVPLPVDSCMSLAAARLPNGKKTSKNADHNEEAPVIIEWKPLSKSISGNHPYRRKI
ncbi:MAG TPA: hypothetical protein VMS89_04110 [Methanoregulaceae archaeon]|nr:hypothetical protein [Methanoregulaceae archaeon]